MSARGALLCALSPLFAACAHPEAKPPAPPKAPPAPSASEAPPRGFSRAVVIGVMPSQDGDGHFVLLGDEDTGALLAITIGQTEALAIHLRMQRRRFERPLTHDLLDDVIERLGGRLVKVQVDDLKGDTFVGSIFLESSGRLHVLDARPSDAIALAVGSRVPIYVSDEVMRRAGITREKLEELRRKLEEEEGEGEGPTRLSVPGRPTAPPTGI